MHAASLQAVRASNLDTIFLGSFMLCEDANRKMVKDQGGKPCMPTIRSWAARRAF